MTVLAMQAKIVPAMRIATGMTDAEFQMAVVQYRKLKAAAEKATSALDAITGVLKAEMDARGVEVYVGGDFKISYKTIVSNRVDTTALKRELPDIAARYSKQSTSKRFTVN